MGPFSSQIKRLLGATKPPNMGAGHSTFERARDLPPHWDVVAADNFYLRRQMLVAIERSIEVKQRYHLFGEPVTDSALVTFRWPLHLSKLRWTATLFGIPGGCSRCGLVLGPRGRELALAFLHRTPGLKLVLSSPDDLTAHNLQPTSRQPSYILDIRWHSFGAYVDAMRSAYRRRVRQALHRCASLTVERYITDAPTAQLYPLYLQVFRRASQRLMPLNDRLLFSPPGETLVVRDADRPIAFAQLFRNDAELLFYKGGLDYRALGGATPDLYLFLLLKLVELGIDDGFRGVDMGKSAGGAKMRLGCRPRAQRTFAAHSNPLLHRALATTIRLRGEVGDASDAVFRPFKVEEPS